MNISSINMSGATPDALLKVTTPVKTTEVTQAAQIKDGDADVSPLQLKQAVAEMQGHLESMDSSLQYCFYGAHDEKVAVKVVNKETGDVIREIPAKEIQALQTEMSELCGMIFNKQG